MSPERAPQFDAFLDKAGWGAARREALPGDASFRRYHRLFLAERRAMLMDAPPDKEDVHPYVRIARLLGKLGFSAPAILAEEPAAGLLLIEDLGDDTYTRLLARGQDEAALYALAVDVLAELQRRFQPADAAGIPAYDDDRLLNEAALLTDWFLPAATGAATPPALRQSYLDAWRQAMPLAHAVPSTLVLRDYHIDNLMLVPGRDGLAACGLLDFQDAVIGPASYDLVSLLEDARRDIAPALAEAMYRRYENALQVADRAAFAASYAVMGAQRSAKIVGIFTRLCVRDGKRAYLAHLPRVWRLLQQDLCHPALAPVRAWFDRHVPSDMRAIPESCRMTDVPKKAMVLAAGLGLRMRPITDQVPKPLIEVAGRTLLDRALDRLEAAGVEQAVVNAHYLADAIVRHLRSRAAPAITISREEALLETGGGVRKALHHFGDKPFYVVNSDITWLDGPRQALLRLASAWDDARMDALLLVHSVAKTDDYDGLGDFYLSPGGKLRRRKRNEIAPFLFTGVQILHPRLFEGTEVKPFSLNLLFDRAEKAGRLFGLVNDGQWFHIGTPSGLAIAKRELPRVERRARAG